MNFDRVDQCIQDELQQVRQLYADFVVGLSSDASFQSETFVRLSTQLKERMCSLLDMQDQLHFLVDRWHQYPQSHRPHHRVLGNRLTVGRQVLAKYQQMVFQLSECGQCGLKCAPLQARLSAMLDQLDVQSVLVTQQPHHAGDDFYGPDGRSVLHLNGPPIRMQTLNYALGKRVDITRLDVIDGGLGALGGNLLDSCISTLSSPATATSTLPSSLSPSTSSTGPLGLGSGVNGIAPLKAEWRATNAANGRQQFKVRITCNDCAASQCSADAHLPRLIRLRISGVMDEARLHLQIYSDWFYVLHVPAKVVAFDSQRANTAMIQFFENMLHESSFSIDRNTSRLKSCIEPDRISLEEPKDSVRYINRLNKSCVSTPLFNCETVHALKSVEIDFLQKLASFVCPGCACPDSCVDRSLPFVNFSLRDWMRNACKLLNQRVGRHIYGFISSDQARRLLIRIGRRDAFVVRFCECLLGSLCLCYLDQDHNFVQLLFTKHQIQFGMLDQYLELHKSLLSFAIRRPSSSSLFDHE